MPLFSSQFLRSFATLGAAAGVSAMVLLAGDAALARPNPGGLGGPASGVGVQPGAGAGRPGVGAGGVGGPASGAGVMPGAGWGAPGPGVEPGVNPGGVGGPASGAGAMPGAGWGRPGAGL